jgi:hypothetical protein
MTVLKTFYSSADIAPTVKDLRTWNPAQNGQHVSYSVKPDIDVAPSTVDPGQREFIQDDAVLYIEIGINKETAVLFDNALQHSHHASLLRGWQQKAHAWMVVDVKEDRPNKEKALDGMRTSWGLSDDRILALSLAELREHIRWWYRHNDVEVIGKFQMWIHMFREEKRNQPELLFNASFSFEVDTWTPTFETHYQSDRVTVRTGELLPLLPPERDETFAIPYHELLGTMWRTLPLLYAGRLWELAMWRQR